MKDLLKLLIFKKTYHDDAHIDRIADACIGVVVWFFIATAIVFTVKAIML